MRGRVGVICLALGILTVVGCGGSKPAEPKAAPLVAAPILQSGTWASNKGGNSVTLSLAKDGRFQAIFKSAGTRSVVKGKATLKDGKITLIASEFDGKPAQKADERTPSTFTHSADWKSLTSNEGVVLARKI